MTEVNPVPSLGWTERSLGATFLRVLADHRRQQGERVAGFREALGWSQETLAQHAGVSVKTISRLENGRHEGRGETLRHIAEALGVSISDVMGPPPPALALGEPSQLDRIEAGLVQISEQLEKLSRAHAQTRRAVSRLERDAETRQSETRDRDRRATDG